MFEAILFDFDGTLVDFVQSDIDSLRWLHAHVRATGSFEDFLETAVDEIMHFHQLVDQNQIDTLLMHHFRLKNSFAKHKISWDDNFVTLYRERLVNACQPFAGVTTMLQTIQPKVKLGLVTNAYDGKEQRARIKNSGLEKFFECIVVAGEIGVYKPDPAIFLQALDQIQASPSQTLFVGDSVTHDIIGAKSAGLKSVFFSKRSKWSDYADYHVNSIVTLADLLTEIIEKIAPP